MSAHRSRSGDAAYWGPAWLQIVGFTTCILILRLLAAACIPLTEDEAYYRLWAQAPALGYFDHPPMIAWWIWGGVRLAGDTTLGVRLLPSLSSAAITCLVFDLGRELEADRATATRGAIWYNATFLVAAGGFLAVPDAPAALFWITAVWCITKSQSGHAGRWWVGAGFAAGLGALSKYSALFLGPGVLLWLLIRRDGRHTLRTPWPWVALIVAGITFGLNVEWNAQHHWLTFAKQFGRIAGHKFAPWNVGDLVGSQLLLLNPLVALWLIRGLAVRSMFPQKAALLLLTALPFTAYLFIHAFHDRVQAHWPAPIYASLAILAALASATVPKGSAWAQLRAGATVLCAGVCGLALGVFILPELGIPLPVDPARQLRGWPAFSRQVEQARLRTGAGWIGTTSYGLAAELLDQSAVHAPVLQIRERDRWLGLTASGAKLSQPGLIIDLTRRLRPGDLHACFAHTQELGALRRGAPGETGLTYRLLRVWEPRRDILNLGC